MEPRREGKHRQKSSQWVMIWSEANNQYMSTGDKHRQIEFRH